MAQNNLSVEQIENLSLPSLKQHLQSLGLSISGEGAGKGGLKKFLESRLKSFLFPEDSSSFQRF